MDNIKLSNEFIADFIICAAQIAGNVDLKIDKTHFLINIRNQVGCYIVLKVGKGRIESYLCENMGGPNMFGVYISPTLIESIESLGIDRNENAAFIASDNYPWEALDNIERRSMTRTVQGDNGDLEDVWEEPKMNKSRKNKK